MVPQYIAAIPTGPLGEYLGDLEDRCLEIVGALDFLCPGF
jgi:hypothetical protein